MSGYPFKIHLGDQALREAGAEDREMDVSGSPTVDEVSKRVRARLDCSEKIMTVIVGDHSSATAEIRIDRRVESIVPVAIATAGVGLPNLDKSSRNRTSVFIQHEAVNDNALPNRVAVFRVVKNQVIIERPEFIWSELRTRDFRKRVLQGPKSNTRRTQPARFVDRGVRGRMNARSRRRNSSVVMAAFSMRQPRSGSHFLQLAGRREWTAKRVLLYLAYLPFA